ncbi:hypothetical protein RQP46_002809 [Phenoliferia psychrophenolica]
MSKGSQPLLRVRYAITRPFSGVTTIILGLAWLAVFGGLVAWNFLTQAKESRCNFSTGIEYERDTCDAAPLNFFQTYYTRPIKKETVGTIGTFPWQVSGLGHNSNGPIDYSVLSVNWTSDALQCVLYEQSLMLHLDSDSSTTTSCYYCGPNLRVLCTSVDSERTSVPIQSQQSYQALLAQYNVVLSMAHTVTSPIANSSVLSVRMQHHSTIAGLAPGVLPFYETSTNITLGTSIGQVPILATDPDASIAALATAVRRLSDFIEEVTSRDLQADVGAAAGGERTLLVNYLCHQCYKRYKSRITIFAIVAAATFAILNPAFMLAKLLADPPLRSAMKPRHSPSNSGIVLNPDELRQLEDAEEEQRGRSIAGLKDSGLGEQTASGASVSSVYSRRVGFDTFESGAELESTGSQTGGGTGVNYSFTVSAKSSSFLRTKQTRTYMVATDLNGYSVHALDWCLTNLVDNNDEVVVLRVLDSAEKSKPKMAEAKDEAEEVLERIMRKNGEQLKLSIIVEFAIGPIEETIHRMIEIYRPDSLVVGTRGLPDSIFKSAFMGSISRYCVAKSPVPVIVVRPEDKVRESLSRRLLEPKKRSYLSLLSTIDQNKVQDLALERSTSASAGTPTPLSAMGKRPATATDQSENGKKDKKKSGLEFKKFATFG